MLQVLAVGLGPVAFCFGWIYLRDKGNREPLGALIFTFLLGCGIVIPAIYLEQAVVEAMPRGLSNLQAAAIQAFVMAALVEEMLKYAVLRLYAYRRHAFDEPYDGIMYAVAASLGFAAIENLMYIASFGMTTGYMRMFTAIPGHTMFAVLMGYFVGRAKFRSGHANASFDHLLGIFAAVLVHGLYDFFLFYNEVFVAPLAFVVLIVGILLARKAVLLHQHKIQPPKV